MKSKILLKKHFQKATELLLSKISRRAEELKIPQENVYFCRLKKAIIQKSDECLKHIEKVSFSDLRELFSYGRNAIIALGNASSLPVSAYAL